MTIPSPPSYSEIFGHPFSTNTSQPALWNLSTSQTQATVVTYRNATENVHVINLPISNVPLQANTSSSINYANTTNQAQPIPVVPNAYAQSNQRTIKYIYWWILVIPLLAVIVFIVIIIIALNNFNQNRMFSEHRST